MHCGSSLGNYFPCHAYLHLFGRSPQSMVPVSHTLSCSWPVGSQQCSLQNIQRIKYLSMPGQTTRSFLKNICFKKKERQTDRQTVRMFIFEGNRESKIASYIWPLPNEGFHLNSRRELQNILDVLAHAQLNKNVNVASAIEDILRGRLVLSSTRVCCHFVLLWKRLFFFFFFAWIFFMSAY